MTAPDDSNGWGEYRKLVLHELRRLEEKMVQDFRAHMRNDERLAEELNETLKGLSESLHGLERDVAGLQVKAGVWGIVGGMVAAVGAAILARMDT